MPNKKKLLDLAKSDTFFKGIVCLLFFVLYLNRWTYMTLYVAGALACIKLFVQYKDKIRARRAFFLVPLPFIAYVTLTPGNFFTDMPLGEVMILAYLTGIASYICIDNIKEYISFSLLLSLVLSLLVFTVSGFPEEMFWNGRLALFFDHPSVLSFISGILFLLLIPMYFSEKGIKKYIAAAGCCVCIAVIGACGSRGTWLALGISSIFLCIFLYRKYLKLIAILGVIGIGLFLLYTPQVERDRLFSAVQSPFTDSTFISRQPIWDAALSGFEESPLLGNGLRSFRTYHGQFITSNTEELKKYPIVESDIASPHSIYMGLPYAYGVIGIALLLILLVPPLVWDLRQKNFLFSALILFYCVYGLFDYPLHRKDGLIILFYLIGLTYAKRLSVKIPYGEYDYAGATDKKNSCN